MTITLTRPAITAEGGRHRLGRSGLVPVTSLVKVIHRGWWSHLLRPGRHVRRAPRARARRSAGTSVPAAVSS